MKKIAIKLGITGMCLVLFGALSITQENFKTLDNIKAEGNTVAITLSGQTKYNAFNMTNPAKLVIEFTNTEHNWKQKELEVNIGPIRRIRSGQFKNEPVKVARVVIDLASPVEYEIKSEGNVVKIYFSAGEKPKEAKKDTAEPVKAAAVKSAVTPVAAPAAAVAASEAPKPAVPLLAPKVEPQPAKQETPKVVQATTKSTQKTPKVKQETPKVKQETPKVTQEAPKPEPQQPVKPETSAKVDPQEQKVTEEAVKTPLPVAVVVNQETPKQLIEKKTIKTDKIPKRTVRKNKTARESGPALKASESKLVNIPKTPVTLDFEDADIRDVLRVLSMKSGINIIFSDDVKGGVTLHLENVPFDKAFETILSLSGLVSNDQGPNILRVATPQKISEERSFAVTFTKVFPLNYAKAEDVKNNLDSVRSAEGRKGSISVDARTNSLVITDTPDGLISIERLMQELDKKPQQVLIEAKIVEMSLNNSYDMGIQWQYAGTPVNNDGTRVDIGRSAPPDPIVSLGAAAGGLAQKDIKPIAEGGTGVSFPAAPSGGQAGSIAFGIIANNNYLTGILTALSQKGLSKILSTPRVTTINNQEAKILVGQKVPYSSAKTLSTIGQTTSTEFLDVGIKLTVTPTVNADNKITLVVNPIVSLYVRADPAGPVLGNREAKTTVLVENGETIVIGGLITEEDRKLGTQVPLLGDLPVIGHLFRRDTKSKDRTELLIFITPRILD